MLFAATIFPEYATRLLYGWAPMAIAEVSTGIWLIVFPLRTRAGRAVEVCSPPAVAVQGTLHLRL